MSLFGEEFDRERSIILESDKKISDLREEITEMKKVIEGQRALIVCIKGFVIKAIHAGDEYITNMTLDSIESAATRALSLTTPKGE